ncbi:MAG: gluconate 2-dehydrogenase subunit 3 family protein [Chitinophagaceae bacterium]
MDRRKAIKNVALLVGGTISAGTLAALLDGCHNTPSTLSAADAFSPNRKKMVSQLADMIIPATETPGALDAGVPDFIVMMMRECYTDQDRTLFIAGLDQLDQDCQTKNGTSFVDCSASQKKELVTALDQEAFGHQGRPQKGKTPHFFRVMKELTLFGYFTSEPGATKALVYVPIPGKYIGCEPLKPGQKSWAT